MSAIRSLIAKAIWFMASANSLNSSLNSRVIVSAKSPLVKRLAAWVRSLMRLPLDCLERKVRRKKRKELKSNPPKKANKVDSRFIVKSITYIFYCNDSICFRSQLFSELADVHVYG